MLHSDQPHNRLPFYALSLPFSVLSAGTYESGIASYKHMYFNATQNTMKMWLLIVIGVIALYECTKHLMQLLLQGKVRYTMIVLFLLSIFSHYYAWWAYLNYYNDEYYHQWNHQLFFTVSPSFSEHLEKEHLLSCTILLILLITDQITELISTSFVLHLANAENQVTARKTLSIVGIALLHILASGVDQFISNVFRGEGYPHQVDRHRPRWYHQLSPISCP